MGRPIVHWEFWSESPSELSDFYKQVFDWSTREIPEMGYHLVETGGEGGINGGIMTPQKGEWPAKLSLYIDVDDIESYAKRVRQAGGRMLVEKMEVPEVGYMALFEDPDGRVLGMWERFEQ